MRPKTAADFFLTANSCQGFVSRFSEITGEGADWHTYILEGAPGTGKSAFISRMLSALERYDSHIERIHNSSAPECLNGAIFHGIKVSFADGSARHNINPRYTGAYETLVPLDACLDADAIYRRRSEIRDISNEADVLSERVSRFLNTAGIISKDTYEYALECTDSSKIVQFASRLVSKELKTRKKDKKPWERTRFLSALSPEGFFMFSSSPMEYCSKIYVIDDDYGAGAKLLLDALHFYIRQMGYNLIVCASPLFPEDKIDHIIVPEAELCFMTSSRCCRPEGFDACRNVHCRRFTDQSLLKRKKQRIKFNRRTVGELFNEAAILKSKEREARKALKKIYASAMDFVAWENYFRSVLLQIAERTL
ncbi:MAG: hypothetical protein LBC56_06515 [Oscillospiraceae bacterium]|nr:hypothetical protein [Oscillospiraceae bacterium]